MYDNDFGDMNSLFCKTLEAKPEHLGSPDRREDC